MRFEAYILDVFTDYIYPAEIIIENGFIKDVTPIVTNEDYKTDLDGILLPGFIDSHIHIESSMLTPAQYAKAAVRYGTTSAICDPHEIANVDGMDAIDFMIENGNSVPFDFYFTAPSCVPATPFETSGAVLDSEDIVTLLKKDEIVALGEMMNFPGVLSRDNQVIQKLTASKAYKKPIDGHAPLLSGEDLKNYVSWDISTDHECTTFEEAIEKKNLGMKIMVREGSSAKSLDTLLDFNKRIKYWRNQDCFGKLPNNEFEKKLTHPIFDFLVSDDKHPEDILNSYLDKLIKKAASLDVDVVESIKMVTINPAEHYGLNVGAILPERKANFVLVDNLNDLNIKQTWINGEVVYNGEEVLFDVPEAHYKNTVNMSKKEASDFDVFTNDDEVIVRVIQCINGELITNEIEANLKVVDNVIQPDVYEDILKIAVVERYGGNSIANAFINGFNLKKGAIASSVSHDSHNIVVVGTNSKDMACAVNLINKNHGGLAIVNDGVENSLALPIAGLMSNEPCEIVASDLVNLQKIAKDLGCNLDSPFMTLSFMALLVIPSLKLSNKGLFNVDSFSFVDLIKDS